MRSHWRKLVAVALFVSFSYCSLYNPAQAAPGDLDRVFGTETIVTTKFSDGGALIQAVTILPDGKVIAAGSAASSNQGLNTDFALARYNSDGSLDTTFGTGGKQTTEFSGFEDAATAMAIQPDGRIVLAGSSRSADGQDNSDFALARYNPNGSLDSSFGAGGKVTNDLLGLYDHASALALQSDGKIIAAGTAISSTIAVALVRYNPDGSLDTSFGAGGKMITNSVESITAIALDPGGKIVAAGYSIGTSPILNYDFAVLRFNSNGSVDATFGKDGKTVTDFIGRDDFALSCALGSDGKIIVAGRGTRIGPGFDEDYDFGLVRYNENGSLDPTFGNGGKVVTDFASLRDQATSISMQPDGKIVAIGHYLDAIPSFRLALARYNPNGSLDATFGNAGRVATSLAGDSITIKGTLQPDSKIVVGGAGGFTLVRYNADGGQDSDFHSRGTTTTDFFNYADSAHAVAVQSDGKIIAAGTAQNQNREPIFGLARYNLDGSLDPTFGTGGKVTDDFGEIVLALLIQPDGKIVAGGRTPANKFGLVRLNEDGSRDQTFGNRGRVETAMLGHETLRALALQPNGRIIAVGTGQSSPFNNSDSRFVIARYNHDGDLDASFGTDGKVVAPRIPNFIDVANAAALQPDGRIVIAGSTDDANSPNRRKVFIVTRYNSNGSLDAGFGTGGRVTNAMSGFGCEARALAIQSDGKIVVGGYDRLRADDFALLRYNQGGTLDAGFGTGGAVTTDFFGRDDVINGLALGPGGRIFAAGSTDDRTRDFALVAYKADGGLDSEFGINGKVTTAVGSSDTANALAIGPDGSIAAAGSSSSFQLDDFAVVRYEGFPVVSTGPTYDLCLLDEGSGDLLRVNSQTGDYQFARCGAQGVVLAGKAKVKLKKSGCLLKLTNNSSDREVTASINTCKQKGSASVRITSTGQTFTLTDRDIGNNQCACP